MDGTLPNLFDKFAQIKAMVFDVDGVLTDATILVTEQGELLRTMNVRDGQAIVFALREDFIVAIITGGRSQGVIKRLLGLGIEDVYAGKGDKMPSFYDFLAKYGLEPSQVLYMGDDMPDVPLMRKAGIGISPKDGCPECLAAADYITSKEGGKGAVREVIEKVMKVQNKWWVKCSNTHDLFIQKKRTITIFQHISSFLKLIRWPNVLIVLFTIWWPSLHVFEFGMWAGEAKPAFYSNYGLNWLMVLIVFTTMGGYVLNDYFDRSIDRINRPDRPSVSFYSAEQLMGIYLACLGIVGFALYFFIENMGYASARWAIWFFSCSESFLGILRKIFEMHALVGNLLVATLCGFVPISLAFTAFNNLDIGLIAGAWLLLLSSFAFFATFIREIVKDIEDIPGDRAVGCNTFANIVGSDSARAFALFLGVFELVAFIWFGVSAGDLDAFVYFIQRDWYLVFLIFAPLIYAMVLLYQRKISASSLWLKVHMFMGILCVPLF